MNDLIDPTQTGFNKADLLLITSFVFMESSFSTRTQKIEGLLQKPDFEKVCGKINIDFILRVLEKRGFLSIWIAWTKAIVTTCKVVMLVNGQAGNWVNCERGTRKGDLLSSFLFILGLDVLTSLLNNWEPMKASIVYIMPMVHYYSMRQRRSRY